MTHTRPRRLNPAGAFLLPCGAFYGLWVYLCIPIACGRSVGLFCGRGGVSSFIPRRVLLCVPGMPWACCADEVPRCCGRLVLLWAGRAVWGAVGLFYGGFVGGV